MPLRAIAAAAVVLSVIAVPRLPAQDSTRRSATGPADRRHGLGPRRRPPGADVPAPLGQQGRGRAPRTSPTTSRSIAARPWCSRSSRATSPAGAPPRCGPSPSSTTRCSGPRSSWWASAPIRSRPTPASRPASNLPFRLLSDPRQEVPGGTRATIAPATCAGRCTSSVPTARCGTATSASTRWTRSTTPSWAFMKLSLPGLHLAVVDSRKQLFFYRFDEPACRILQLASHHPRNCRCISA